MGENQAILICKKRENNVKYFTVGINRVWNVLKKKETTGELSNTHKMVRKKQQLDRQKGKAHQNKQHTKEAAICSNTVAHSKFGAFGTKSSIFGVVYHIEVYMS